MDSLPQQPGRNYTPHLYQTRLHSCKRIRESHWEVWKVLSYYHVKRSSLYRWLRRFDELGENGLRDHSHKPKTPHPSTISPQGRLQGQMLPRPGGEAQLELRGHMGQDGLVRVPDVLFHRLEVPEEAGGVQALRDQSQKALQEIPNAAFPGRQMADGRQVRPRGMQIVQAPR